MWKDVVEVKSCLQSSVPVSLFSSFFLILADSMAAIQAVKKAGRTGKARSRELVRVMREVRRRGNVRFAWVKAHVGR